MKKINKISASVAVLASLVLISNETMAMYQEGGKGMGNGKMNKSGIQTMSTTSGEAHSPAHLLEGVEKSDLSIEEENKLYYQYSEEKLAHDMYMHFYDLYGTQTFSNIAKSEMEHMNAVKSLLDRYGLETPTDYGELVDEYKALKEEGSKGLKEALEVGVKIEILDIEDIITTIKLTDNDDIKIVFTNIGGASYNHMRGFLKALANNSFETEIDYGDYLSDDLIDSKGSLKHLLSEKLVSDGVEIPEQVSSENIKKMCAEKEKNKGKGNGNGNGEGKGEGMKNGMGQGQSKGKAEKQNSRYKKSNPALVNKYKATFKSKYTNQIKKLDRTKARTLVEKVDALAEKIDNGDYSELKKEQLHSLLDGFKQTIMEIVGE